ncbi:MAG: hypothetical protein QF809_01460 [Candidatus Peribacteraceae bacterium]|nr:hypothetical protein [Candidatus Peribacteraceae bacterium]MDP7645696.1 hypothetical protein [Candidatus Peribacteraceae bacterium]
MDTLARHSDGSQVTKGDIILMQGRVISLWKPNLEADKWKLSESELVSVWGAIFAKFVRDMCNGHPVDFEALERELMKMQDEVLHYLDLDKHLLGEQIGDDPGWVAVGQLFQARVAHLISDPTTHVPNAADVAVEFPVVYKPELFVKRQYGRPPEYESNPKLIKAVAGMTPSVCFESEVPFQGVSAV